MKRHILFLLPALFLTSLSILAQPAGMGRGAAGGFSSQTGRFYGKIVDAGTGKGIDAVSVQLVSSKFDMVKRQRKDTIIAGQLTPSNGDFSLEGVPMMGDYRLKISAIGYKVIEQKISFLTPEMQEKLTKAFMQAGAQSRVPSTDSTQNKKPAAAAAPNMMEILKSVFGSDMRAMASLADKDLGNIKLEQDAKVLENVTVTGSKPMMQMAIDRRIFNVDKSLAASGSTGIDIMRQIPTVNVDVDGNVSIRNSAPTLFIDGRPTTLTLDQIPADDIQSVELITNPSAKYDASGGAASILNVVLKKNRKAGYNGSVRAGMDSRFRPNLGGDINVRQGKINAFLSGNYSMRKSISNSDISTVYNASQTQPSSKIIQGVDNTNRGYFAFFRGGLDYFIDNRNTITFALNYVRGTFKSEETNQMRYDTFYNPLKTETGFRNSLSERTFQNLGVNLNFKHNFAKPGHEYTADINFNKSKNNGQSDFENQMFFQNNQPKGSPTLQITESGGSSTFVVAQTDYANPISKTLKFEGGLRGQFRTFDSKNDNFIFNYTTNQYQLIPNISANYTFTDAVYAVYGTVTGKLSENSRFGYNLGLRAESSNYNGKLVGGTDQFNVDFPLSLFPSAFFSYKLTDKSDWQMNYTRRINRPNFFQLIPFIDYTDPLNLSVGNAALQPEFTNSIEMNYSYQINNQHSILASGYYKYTTDLLTRFQYKDKNPVTKDSAIFNTWVNANSSTRYGFELTSTNKWTKKFDMVTNFNIYNAKINSENLVQNLNTDQTSFYGKMTLTYKLGKTNNWTLQANGDYQSRTILPVGGGGGGRSGGGMSGGGSWGGGSTAAGSNGYVNPNYGVDFSIRRDIIKAKGGQGYMGSLTLSMNDIFRTRLYDATTSSDFFLQNLTRRRDPQILRFQFNWRFGKTDATLFKRKNMRGEMEGLSEGMQSAQ